MSPSASPAEAGLQSFTLGQDSAQDPSGTMVSSSFGTLLDQDAVIGQGPAKAKDLQSAPLIPSGIPLTAGCVAQVAAQQCAQASAVVASGAGTASASPQPGVSPLPQQSTQAAQPASGMPTIFTGAESAVNTTGSISPDSVAAPGKPSTKAGAVPLLNARVGSGKAAPNPNVVCPAGQGGASEKNPVEDCLSQDPQGTGADVAEDNSDTASQDNGGSESAAQSLPNALAAELVQIVPQPVSLPVKESSSPETGTSLTEASTPATPKDLSTTRNQAQTWTSLRQETASSDKPVQTGNSAVAPQPVFRVESALTDQAAAVVASRAASYGQPTIRSSKALAAYDAGLQTSSPQATSLVNAVQGAVTVTAAQVPAATTETPVKASDASSLTTEAATELAGQPVQAKSVSLSLESSASALANAKDGTAKEGAASGPRGGDSTGSLGGANSAATPSVNPQVNASPLQKKAQLADGQSDEKSTGIDGTRNAKSEANMSISRRTRTVDTRSEEIPATASSSVPVTRAETVHAAQKATPSESAQRTVAAVTELVDRLQARPTTKVAIDVPLSGEQNVSVKLEYKAGVLHVNFRTDSTELRDALSREWSTVAAQGDSALRFAEPSFNSNSQNHGQQQSKADAFDLSWNRQGQPQQQRNQQQEEAARAFSLPGSRSSTSSSTATDGVINRDRTTASRQVAPETTRHLNVVA